MVEADVVELIDVILEEGGTEAEWVPAGEVTRRGYGSDPQRLVVEALK